MLPMSEPEADLGPSWGTLIAVNRDGVDGKSYALRGGWVEVGSAAVLCFEDRYLARAHVRLELVEGQPTATPLDQFNGTYLRLRGEAEITDGDCVLIGRELLRFEEVQSGEQDVVQLVQHGVAFFGSPVRKTWGRLSEILPNGAVRDVRHLSGNEFVIGREEGDLVFVDDEFMSRKHASIQPRSSHFVIADLGSSNGTFLRIRERTVLSAADVLRFGDQMFRFEPA